MVKCIEKREELKGKEVENAGKVSDDACNLTNIGLFLESKDGQITEGDSSEGNSLLEKCIEMPEDAKFIDLEDSMEWFS